METYANYGCKIADASAKSGQLLDSLQTTVTEAIKGQNLQDAYGGLLQELVAKFYHDCLRDTDLQQTLDSFRVSKSGSKHQLEFGDSASQFAIQVSTEQLPEVNAVRGSLRTFVNDRADMVNQIRAANIFLRDLSCFSTFL